MPWERYNKLSRGEGLKASEIETESEIDKKLNFESHIKTLCSKASQKPGTWQRISNLLMTQKKYLLFNTVIQSQFSYYPLVWMFCSRRSNSLVSHVYEIVLRVGYDDHSSSCCELILAKNEPTTLQHNIKIFMGEMCKLENELSPILIDGMFQVRKNSFYLRHFQKIASNKKTRKKWVWRQYLLVHLTCGIWLLLKSVFFSI